MYFYLLSVFFLLLNLRGSDKKNTGVDWVEAHKVEAHIATVTMYLEGLLNICKDRRKFKDMKLWNGWVTG